ncbi:MAG: hypothetical protein GY716_04755 [bacterium]|nr:hypothetical protein [bacterium]
MKITSSSRRSSLSGGLGSPRTNGLALAALALYGFVAIFISYLVWIGPSERPHHYFTEGSPVDWISSTFLMTSALLAWCVWFIDRGAPFRERIVWGACAVGLATIALDERFQFHERLDSDWLEPWLGDPTWIKSWNDLTVALYFLVAVALAAVVLPTILRVRGFREFLGLGFVFFAIHNYIDMSFEHSSIKTETEESFKLLAGASFVLAFRQAAFERAATRIEASRPRVLRDVVAIAVAMTFALVVLGGGSDWQDELVKKWGDPSAWLVAALLGAATLLFGFVALRSRSADRLLWGGLTALTGVFGADEMLTATLVGMDNWKVRHVMPELTKDPPAILRHGIGWGSLLLLVWAVALFAAAAYGPRQARTRLIVAGSLLLTPVLLAPIGVSDIGAGVLDVLRIAAATMTALGALVVFEAQLSSRPKVGTSAR